VNLYALLKDYAVRYYGPKAGPLIGTYYTEWARNPDLAYRVKDDARLEYRETVARQRKKFIDPALRAARTDRVLAHRVGKVAKLHTLAEKLCEMYRQRDEIRRLRVLGKFDQATARLDKARVYTDRLLDFFYELADLNQGLMDRNEVPSFIKMKVKGWIEEEAKNVAAGDSTVPKGFFEQLDETQMLPTAVTGDK
jgi:hypothetical protein